MLRTIVICLFLMSIIIPAIADSKKIHVDLDMNELIKGNIQTFTEEFNLDGKGSKKRIVGVILIDAPCSKVWSLISNWDKMGEYVPGLKYYKTLTVIKKNDESGIGKSIIEGYVKIPIPFVNRIFTLEVTFNKPQWRVDWKMLSPKEIEYYRTKGVNINNSSPLVKNIEGFGYLEPYNNKIQTIFYYIPTLEITGPVPGIVERYLSVTGLKGFLKAIKERSEIMHYEHISIY